MVADLVIDERAKRALSSYLGEAEKSSLVCASDH